MSRKKANPQNGPKRTLMDLVPDGPIRSPVFDFMGQPTTFKLLDSAELIQCRIASERHTLDLMVEELGLERKDAYALIHAGSSTDTQREWFEYFCLAAAMCDEDGGPIAMGSADDVVYVLMDKTTPVTRGQLVDHYYSFALDCDPLNLPQEEIEEIVANWGKPEGERILKRSGLSSLRSFITTIVPRLIKAEMAVAAFEEVEDLDGRVKVLEAAISPTSRSSDGTESP